MNIALKPEQQKWLDEQLAAGAFASADDAVRLAFAGLMDTATADDLAWAAPLADEARSSIARGEGIPAARAKAAAGEQVRKLVTK